MMKSKSVVKKLTTILFTLVAVFTIGLTNVNAETTAEVADLDSLESAMNDNATDVVKLTSDITLRENLDTTFSLKMSKTLDFNGFTLTIPQQYKLKLIYYNTLDLKFINSSSRKTAKLNLLTDTGYTPIYNEIKKAEYTVNFEMDGIDVEYIKDLDSFWQTAGDYRFNNVVFKNLKVTGFHEMVDTRAYKSVKFSNVTKESKNTPYKTHLINSSTLTVDDVIDADSIIEYYPSGGTKVTANRTATLDTIDAYWGPITVKFANSINEIRLVGDVQYGTVPAGILPSFNPGTTTENIFFGTGTAWAYFINETSVWSGFGSETPVAVNDGKTKYGYRFQVKTNSGYQLASDLKVIYNDEDVTSTVEVTRWPWGAYVTVDLGKAIGTPVVYTITFISNDGTPVAPQNVNAGEKLKEPTPAPTKEGFTFDGWYEEATFNTKFDFNTPITSNRTLYANWIENKYILTFNANGGSGTMAPIADLTGEFELPANKFTAPTGKQFKGWSLTTDGAIVNKVDMTENKTVYAIWEEIPVVKYTLTFNANGGSGTMAPIADLTGEFELPANKFTAPTGKQFKGWSLTTDGAIVNKVDMTENKTVYAIWEEIPVVKYTLTFNANGGSGTMAPIADLTGEFELPANKFTAPTGKQFKGWSLTADGAIVTKVDMTENRTVYAIWEEIPVVKYTLTFNANGGSGTMAPIADLTGEFELPANKFTAPTGKQFKGWSLTTDGAIVNKVNMTENKTVYAIWEEIPVVKYTLTFNANGGSGTMAPIADLTGEFELPANKFTAPTGKQFKGWSLTADGAIVNKVDMTENRTVYAIWEDIIYSYEFLESTGEQTIDGKANSFKIVIDADETKFVSLEIDGVLYEKDVDYTVKHGSTIIEFTSTGLAKLNALSKGEHNVRVTFTDEVINGKITVNTVNPPIIPQNPDIDNPQTYDGIFTYITMFVVSILGLITAVIIGKKRTRTN